MPSHCVVPNCRSNYTDENKASIFRFPADETMKKRWIAAIPRKNWKVTNSSRVCEVHFKETDIRTESSAFDEKTGKWVTAKISTKRLQESAVPSIFNQCPVIENEQFSLNKRNNNTIRCSYCYVHQSTVPGKKYFRFPSDPAMCKKWVLACERPFLLNKTAYQLHNSYRLCSDHFRPSDYMTSKMCRLKPTAYPQFISEPVSVKISDDCNLITKMRHNLSEKLNIPEDKESDPSLCNTDNSTDASTVIAVLTSTPMSSVVSEDVPTTHNCLGRLEIPTLWLPEAITKDTETVMGNGKSSERRFCSVARKKIRKVQIDGDPISSKNLTFDKKEKQQETDAEALHTVSSMKRIPIDKNEAQEFSEKAPFHQPCDSEDIFGQYVANEIRTLKDNYLLYLKTKQSILETLSHASFQLIKSK